jgi:hypothetical protein
MEKVVLALKMPKLDTTEINGTHKRSSSNFTDTIRCPPVLLGILDAVQVQVKAVLKYQHDMLGPYKWLQATYHCGKVSSTF